MRPIGLVVVLTLSLFVAPVDAGAQQMPRMPRIGVLAAGTADEAPNISFFERLREMGYVEGQNVVFERRFAAGRIEVLPSLAAQLIATKPDVIFAPVTPAALAARNATQSIPIVFAVAADPIGAGLVASLRQPGGNVTGVTSLNAELAAKRLELLKEAAPKVSRVAVLMNPDNVPDQQQLSALSHVAAKLRVAVVPIAMRRAEDYTHGFTNVNAQSVDAIMTIPSPLNLQFRTSIFEFALHRSLPTMDADDRGPRDGALMSYGASWEDNFRQAAQLVDRILKGASPRDLPVEQPTRFQLVINLKTAKALGLTIPQSVLLRADQVIDQ
jgi:putative ABC transport system substrate-binding protein